MIHQMTPEGLAVQEKAGFPFLQGQQPTLRAINALWFFAERAGRAPAALPPAPRERSFAGKSGSDARALRHHAGAKPRRDQRARGGRRRGGNRISGGAESPLAPTIVHKTEAGGVMLDLASEQQVIDAADALVKSARATHPDATIDGFLVQEMVSGVETIVGAHSDPLYGPLLLVGSGGIMVEFFRDVAQRLLPVDARDIGKMIDGLKLSRLLAGYRGRPAADRSALEASALALARFYLDHRARISEIEINPLMVRAEGAVAVDVRVAWREGVRSS